MRGHFIWVTLVASLLTTWYAKAEQMPVRHTVKVPLKGQPEMILNGGPHGEGRSNIDSVVTSTPPAVAKAVQDWTGISDRGKAITVKFYHTPHNSRYVAMSVGDGYSHRTSVKVGGKTLAEEDTHVCYQEALTASDEKTFCVWGVYAFENRLTRRTCYVVCHIEGEKPASDDPNDAVIHPTGTATWIGPIANASSVLFPANNETGKK